MRQKKKNNTAWTNTEQYYLGQLSHSLFALVITGSKHNYIPHYYSQISLINRYRNSLSCSPSNFVVVLLPILITTTD